MNIKLFIKNLAFLLSEIFDSIIANPWSALPSICLPGLVGNTIGHYFLEEEWDNWLSKKKNLWISYSFLFGFLLLIILSIPVAYLCTVNPEYADNKISILYYSIVVVWIILGLINLRKTLIKRGVSRSRTQDIFRLISR